MNFYHDRMVNAAVQCLRSYSEMNPEHTLTVAVNNLGFDDDQIFIYDGDRVQARIWIRGYPTPSRERYTVRVVKDYSSDTGQMLRKADELLEGLLEKCYRSHPLRPRSAPSLQSLLDSE